jgi:hypothetical protein
MYQLTEVTKYAVNCENCNAGTGNHTQAETAQKAAKAKGFIAIATAEDGTINFCPACIPADVAKFFKAPAAEPVQAPPVENNAPLKAEAPIDDAGGLPLGPADTEG